MSYGTIENHRLRVLFLVAPEHERAGRAMARAVSAHHQTEVAVGAPAFAGLQAAKAADGLKPHLIHSVGATGLAKSAAKVALGRGCAWVASLYPDDLEVKASRSILDRAHGVVLDAEPSADRARQAGVKRELYVTSTPESPNEEPYFLGSIEIVYGRAVELSGVDISDCEAPKDESGEPLVQIGNLEK